MTQGYGSGDGQQPQWGQGEQPGQQPGWAQQASPAQAPAQPGWSQQASPAPAPAQPQWNQVPSQVSAQPGSSAPNGYPGAATSAHPGATGYPGSGSATGVRAKSTLAKVAQAMLILLIAVIAVRVIREVVGFVVSFISGAAVSGGSVDGGMAVAGGGVILGLLFLALNGLVSIALLAVSIYLAVQTSGRGRTGAIIVAATLLVAVVLYWIVYGIYYAVMVNATDYSMIGIMSIIYLIAEVVRSLIVFAALIVGTLMTRRWVKQNA